VTILSCHDHIESFASRREVNLEFIRAISVLNHLLPKSSYPFANRRRLIEIVEAMTVKLYEEPFRSTFDMYPRASPAV
jgi:hypothetical protein